MVEEQLHSLGAFFNASENVDATEFNTFSRLIFRDTTQVKIFGWLPVIAREDQAQFEKQLNDMFPALDLSIRPFDAQMSTLKNESYNAPLQYVYPTALSEYYLAVDFLSHQEFNKAMLKANQLGTSVATLPINSNLNGLEGNNIYVFSSLLISSTDVGSAQEAKYAAGYLVAVVDAFELFNPKSISIEHSKKVSLFIEDVSNTQPLALYGNELNDQNRLIHASEMDAFSRQWRITIGETEPSMLQPRSWINWGVLVGAHWEVCYTNFLFC